MAGNTRLEQDLAGWPADLANAHAARRKLLVCSAGWILSACSSLRAARPPTGDQQRSYRHAAAGIESPFRLYVPLRWDGTQQLPLVVMLHGHSGDHNSPFDQTPPDSKGIVQQLAVHTVGGVATEAQVLMVIVPMKGWDRVAHKSLRFALKLSDEVYAVQIRSNEKI